MNIKTNQNDGFKFMYSKNLEKSLDLGGKKQNS